MSFVESPTGGYLEKLVAAWIKTKIGNKVKND